MSEPTGIAGTIETTPEWSLSQEREFMENLVQQRFDFLLVVYSLIVAGALSTESDSKFKIALAIGAVICTLLSLTVYRAHVKLDQLLIVLHRNPAHPVAISGKRVKAIGVRGLFGVSWIIGWLIPLLCSLSLVVGAFLAFTGQLKAA